MSFIQTLKLVMFAKFDFEIVVSLGLPSRAYVFIKFAYVLRHSYITHNLL